jgi:Fe-S-cluster-containing dehydrogenase component
MADHRLTLRAHEVADFAYAVARELRAIELGDRSASTLHPQWLQAVVSDLQKQRGASLVIAGEQQPPHVHALAHAMNHALGNVGTTVFYTDPVEAGSLDQMGSLRELVADMQAGLVDLLVILGGNPLYQAPAELHFSEHLSKVKLRVHLGLCEDETADLCHWHIPETHYLETWTDARAFEGRNLVRVGTLSQYLAHPEFVHEMAHEPPPDLTLYPPHKYKGYAWGMAIDLNACIGCNACVVACQAENNILIVGKRQVTVGRVMHWLRIDRYYNGGVDDPDTYFQPILCMHCENAPCEVVCPVAAMVHDDEGLNVMVYNRCVGTRYCSYNCPYKVRRFNFLQYTDDHTPVLKLLRNPNVTVRSRGVMEKCTYCVQRISAARIQAEKDRRVIREGELVTACQASCPTEAIVFGNINDLNIRVSKLKTTQLNYGLLTDLNTWPRTTHLARQRHPHPDLAQHEEGG